MIDFLLLSKELVNLGEVLLEVEEDIIILTINLFSFVIFKNMKRNFLTGTFRFDATGKDILRKESRWTKEEILKYIIFIYYFY